HRGSPAQTRVVECDDIEAVGAGRRIGDYSAECLGAIGSEEGPRLVKIDALDGRIGHLATYVQFNGLPGHQDGSVGWGTDHDGSQGSNIQHHWTARRHKLRD